MTLTSVVLATITIQEVSYTSENTHVSFRRVWSTRFVCFALMLFDLVMHYISATYIHRYATI